MSNKQEYHSIALITVGQPSSDFFKTWQDCTMQNSPLRESSTPFSSFSLGSVIKLGLSADQKKETRQLETMVAHFRSAADAETAIGRLNTAGVPKEMIVGPFVTNHGL